jgi:hypothetical protein
VKKGISPTFQREFHFFQWECQLTGAHAITRQGRSQAAQLRQQEKIQRTTNTHGAHPSSSTGRLYPFKGITQPSYDDSAAAAADDDDGGGCDDYDSLASFSGPLCGDKIISPGSLGDGVVKSFGTEMASAVSSMSYAARACSTAPWFRVRLPVLRHAHSLLTRRFV